MWPLKCPKKTTTTTTTTTMKIQDESVTTTTVSTKSVSASGSTCHHCFCLVTKLMRKLKRPNQRRTLHQANRLYDPLSYSLNFDSTGCGNLILDDDYYKFYAFSSRFVANPRTSCPI